MQNDRPSPVKPFMLRPSEIDPAVDGAALAEQPRSRSPPRFPFRFFPSFSSIPSSTSGSAAAGMRRDAAAAEPAPTSAVFPTPTVGTSTNGDRPVLSRFFAAPSFIPLRPLPSRPSFCLPPRPAAVSLGGSNPSGLVFSSPTRPIVDARPMCLENELSVEATAHTRTIGTVPDPSKLSKQAEGSLEPPSEGAPSEPQGRTSPREALSNNAEEKSAHDIGCDPALDTGRERDEGLITSDEDSDEDRSTPSDPEEQTRSEEAPDEWPNPAEAQMLTAPTELSEPASEPLSVEVSCVVEAVPKELSHVEPRAPSAPASPSNPRALVACVEFAEARPKELGRVEPPMPSAPASPSNPGALVARIEVELIPTSSVDACVLLEPAGPSESTAEPFVPTEDRTCKVALPEPIEPLPSVEEHEPAGQPSERVAVESEAVHSSEEGPAHREPTATLVSTEGKAPCGLQASEPVSMAPVLLEACGCTLAGLSAPTARLIPETKSLEPPICEVLVPVQLMAAEVVEQVLPPEPQAAVQDRPRESEVEGTPNEPVVEMSEPSTELELRMEVEPATGTAEELKEEALSPEPQAAVQDRPRESEVEGTPNEPVVEISESSTELELRMEIEPATDHYEKRNESIEEEESTTQPAPTISIEAENCSGEAEEASRTEADNVTVEQPIALDGELQHNGEHRAGPVRGAQEEIVAAFGEITVETPNTTEENEERKEDSEKDRMDVEVAPQGEEEANELILSLIEESEKEEREAAENDQREDTTDQRVQEDQTEREKKQVEEEVPCASVDASSSFDVWLRTEALPLSDDTRPSPTTRPNSPLASVTIDRPASPGGAEEHDAWQRLLRQLRQRGSEGRGTTAAPEAERAPAFAGCGLPAAEGSEPQLACEGRKRGLAELAFTDEGREARPGTPPGNPPRKKAFKEPADVDAVVATGFPGFLVFEMALAGIPMKLFEKPQPPLPYASKSFRSAVGRKRKRVPILHPNAQQPKAKPAMAMLDPFATNEWEE